ncbi:MAG: hypothetical protein ACJ8BF_01175 [Gemmatimonadales bacterium]
MKETILGAGLACLIAAVIGGGLKGFGLEVPIISSLRRQVALGILGVLLIVAANSDQERGTGVAAPQDAASPNPAPQVGATRDPPIRAEQPLVPVKSKDSSITISISYDPKVHDIVDSKTVVYMLGKPMAELHLTKEHPFHTASITLPRPGTYKYRLEQTQHLLREITSDPEGKHFIEMRNFLENWSGEGTIEASEGSAFKVGGIIHSWENIELKLVTVP